MEHGVQHPVCRRLPMRAVGPGSDCRLPRFWLLSEHPTHRRPTVERGYDPLAEQDRLTPLFRAIAELTFPRYLGRQLGHWSRNPDIHEAVRRDSPTKVSFSSKM